jgi:hypothetical protein
MPSSLPFNAPFGNPKENAENRESNSLFAFILSTGAHCDANLIATSGGPDKIFIL